jgi:hypothetical protein
MRCSLIVGLCVVLCGAMVANAYTIPVSVTAGNISVGCSRYSYDGSYDEVDFYLTGMRGATAALGTDGSQVRINIIQGRWTANPTGAFWVPSNASNTIQFQGKSTNAYWEVPTYSTVNFDSYVGGATIWTNNAGGGGRGPQTSGNLYNYFSGCWYTTDYNANLVHPANPSYSGLGTDSTSLAALYVTKATPDVGLACDAQFGFTYNGGTVEWVHFATIPEPGTLALLAGAAMGLVAYAWRKRK